MDKKRKPKTEDLEGETGGCMICGQYPYLSQSGMCGPCTFGTADALGEGDISGPADEAAARTAEHENMGGWD